MSTRRNTKRGLSPKTAVVLLLGCSGFAYWSWHSSFTPVGSGAVGHSQSVDVPDEDGEVPALEVIRWRDLLDLHGSYDGRMPVRMAFTVMSEAVPGTAAPLGEGELVSRWRGQDPPMLRIGVVMVSEASRRAVLEGQVVGVGDHIAEGVVTGIEPGLVRLRWQGRELTYDLDGPAPREFRTELAMRQAEGAGDDGDSTDSDPQAMEEGK